MTDPPVEIYLLFVLLIISSASLYLLILNTLHLFDLKKRVDASIQRGTRKAGRARNPQETGGKTPDGREAGTVSAPAGKSSGPGATARGRVTIPAVPGDINAGIGMIVQAYQLDSIVLATPDGLVVASSGSRDPEYEAAHYSSLADGRISDSGDGVLLLEVGRDDTRGIGIVRGLPSPSPGTLSDLRRDLDTVVTAGLAGHSG